jgi:hypothetical protein
MFTRRTATVTISAPAASIAAASRRSRGTSGADDQPRSVRLAAELEQVVIRHRSAATDEVHDLDHVALVQRARRYSARGRHRGDLDGDPARLQTELADELVDREPVAQLARLAVSTSPAWRDIDAGTFLYNLGPFG